MAAIRSSSATAGALYCHFIIFVIVAIFNFSVGDNQLPINMGYGLSLCLLSLTSLLISVTSPREEDSLLRSLLMTISAMWAGLGLYQVVESITPQAVTDSEALFAGYGTFLLTYIIYLGGSLYHKDHASAVVALGMMLSSIFEIAALWRPVRQSAAAYYLLLAAVVLYLTVSKLLVRYREGELKTIAKSSRGDEAKGPRDFVPMGHVMNTLAAAVMAGHVTGIYDNPAKGFSWVLVAGLYQMVAAGVAVRRSELYHGFYFFFHGLFWLSNGFNLIVVFVNQVQVPFLVAATVIHVVVFFVIALVSMTREMYQLPQSLSLCILCIAFLVDGYTGRFVGAMGWILFAFSLYALAAHISRVKKSGLKLPLGARLIHPERFTNSILSYFKCCLSNVKTITTIDTSKSALFSSDFTLGYSRYSGFEFAGFGLNAIAAIAILWSPSGVWVLPWAVILGGLAQMAVGSVSFAKGLSFESCAFFTFGALWLIWGPARDMGNLNLDNSAAIITGGVAFLVVGLLLLGLSIIMNKAWTAVTFSFNLVVIGVILNALNANGSFIYEIVVNVLFVVVCMYVFVATAVRSVWGRELLPLGKPFVQVSYLHSQGEQALWADGRKASGVKEIANIMNNGGICGIPTDVVYVLVAALKFPKAVERAYNTKKLAEDRPMSMWISKTEQLEGGRALFGELVWGLMNEIWPSTVSLVVPKGQWLLDLGVGESEKYIGRPDSIAVRMPDNAVTSHLIDQTGPVSTSSANPTGEADTTHHLQVLAKLGLENVDGILCSGPSPENMASTVVDCRQLNAGKIGFFRVGVVPRSHVEAIFAKVQAAHSTIPPSVSGLAGGPKINPAFSMEDEEKPKDATNDDNKSSSSNNNSSNDRNSSNSSSTRNSLDASFADSTQEDDAELIRSSTNSGTCPLSGVKSQVNRIYDSLVPMSPRNRNIYEQSKAFTEDSMNGQLDASDRTSAAASSENSPYEPMKFVHSPSGAELIEAGKVIGGKKQGPS